MTQFKVGDRVLVKDSTLDPIPETIAMIGTMCEVRHVFYKNDRAVVWNEGKTDWWTFNLADLDPVPSTPPATIQHEGYNYTRGEPVVPEWVKDGAWVVHKENGELNQLIAGDPGYFKAVNKKTWHAFVLDFHPSMSVSDVFRPFTNEDWKWGMWAEYKGEKVFVMNSKDQSGYIEIAMRPNHTTPLDGWTFIEPSELTPTTAP